MERHLTSTMIDHDLAEHDLQADSDSLLGLALSAFELGSWRIDLKTGKVWWSRRMFEIHGQPYSEEPLDLETVIVTHYVDDAASIGKLITGAVEQKKGFSYVLRLRTLDGTTRLVEAVGSIRKSPSGNVECLFGLMRDATDKYAKKDISDARRRLLKTIIKYSPLPIAVTDRKMNYLEVGDAWAEYHGLGSVKELVGANHVELFPDLPAEWKEEHAKVLAGNIVRRDTVAPGRNGEKSDNAGVLVPWQNSDGKVAGIIIMHVPQKQLADPDQSFLELAEMMAP